ncbi:MAG: DUF1598 domain-containing protein [Planctomycetia bacterium]|nr:DUF1598 domain-containing protein [Planctomycetia bacterium]
MLSRRNPIHALALLLSGIALVAVSSSDALGQGGGGAAAAGVIVDANGVLRMHTVTDPTGELMRAQVQSAKAARPGNLAVGSKLRYVSITRLEQAVEAQAANDRKPTDEMKYLAGLTRIKYVFCYPDSGDIVIAGPAEGWVDDLSGRTIGLTTGRPVLELQDLVAAMRAYAPGQNGGPVVGCSIDPTQEGLQRMQEFLRNLGGQATPNDTQFIVDGLRTNLGLQTVRIMGVAPTTHFAQVLVEADYRMKLIGVGLEPPQVKMTTFIDKADPSMARNALFRWFFVPDYKCVRVSEDGQAMELVGDGVKLVDEKEVVLADGKRSVAAGEKNRASLLFTTAFTAKYAELAARKPIYAQLRNLIDLTVAAAFMQQHDYYGKTERPMTTFLSEEKFPIQTYTAPVQVDTVVTSVWKGNRLLTPVAGGVTIQPRQALATDNQLEDQEGKIAQARKQVSLQNLKPGQWWWDVDTGE